MKLAEALQERADLNRRIQQLQVRLANNAVVQEGEAPAEDPRALLAELDGCLLRQEELMGRINLTNCRTVVDGKTLTEHIARKDCLNIQLRIYRDLVSSASQTARRATRTEIRILSAVNVKEVQSAADALAKELRQLDNRLQETNWTTELL